MKKTIRLVLSVFVLDVLLSSCQTVHRDDSPDYSDPSAWAYWCEGDGEADLFLICPTVDMGRAGNLNMSMDDADIRRSFVGALNMERGIYEDTCTMYAPFYRQMTFPVYEQRIAGSGEHLEIAYGDVKEAFEHFLAQVDDDRPIVLAGFSQGAQLALLLLEEYFDDPELADRLVAAYCIGWPVTDDDLAEHPHLRMAQGEDDTGVVVTFNSEAEGIEDSMLVPEGMKTNAINPLNWRTDSTFADRSLNKGACFTDYSGAVKQEIPGLTGAHIDSERGTLRVVDVDPEDYSSSLFPDGVYHLYDYQFFFRDLQENVQVRTQAWLDAHEPAMAA